VTVRSRYAITLAVVLVVLCRLSPAGFASPMTLDDCVSKALEANPGVLDAREAIARAAGGVTEARSGYLPNLLLTGSYNFLEEAQTVDFPDPLTGKTQQLKIDFTRDYVFQLVATQPLYTGGRLGNSYRIANRSRGMAETELTTAESQVTLDVVQAFYGLLLAREAVTVAQEAVNTAEEFLRVVKARYQTGEASSFEVMRAEVEVSNLQPALIAAKNGVALSELSLKKAMGVSQDADIQFTGSFEAADFEISLRQALAKALSQRSELKTLAYQAQIAEASIGLAKSGRLPSLSLDFNYNVSTDKITLDSDQIEDTYNGYLTLSFPLFDGFRTKSQISQARTDLRRAGIAKTNLEEAIELEVRGAFLDIESAREVLESQDKNVEMAEESLRIANERYVQGYATNLEVLDSQLALNTARQNRLQAVHDLNVAIARLKKAMGTLLGEFEAGAR
jgi:outer membrane protein